MRKNRKGLLRTALVLSLFLLIGALSAEVFEGAALQDLTGISSTGLALVTGPGESGQASDESDSSRPISADDPIILQDDADLFSAQDEEMLWGEAEALLDRTGFPVRIVTVSSTGGRNAERFLDDYMDAHYLSNMVAFMIDMDNREIRIGTDGNAIYYLTDSRIDDILDSAYERVSSGDYTGCILEMISGTSHWYDKGIPGNQYIYDETTGQIIPYVPPKKVSLFEGLIAAVLSLLSALGMRLGVKGSYNMENPAYQYDPKTHSRMELQVSRDTKKGTFVARRHIPRVKVSGSSGGGGGSSTVHHSGGGHTYGGGGRKF